MCIVVDVRGTKIMLVEQIGLSSTQYIPCRGFPLFVAPAIGKPKQAGQKAQSITYVQNNESEGEQGQVLPAVFGCGVKGGKEIDGEIENRNDRRQGTEDRRRRGRKPASRAEISKASTKSGRHELAGAHLAQVFLEDAHLPTAVLEVLPPQRTRCTAYYVF